jgi:acetate kinase
MSDPGSDSLVLTINGGSSSLKFALFRLEDAPGRILSGKFERIGLPDSLMTISDPIEGQLERRDVHITDHVASIDLLLDYLEHQIDVRKIQGIGHRVVHGGRRYTEPQRVTPEVLAELRRLSPYDPEHLPAEIGLIEAFSKRYPDVAQVACFDTAFHRALPPVARLLPIPRRYEKSGVQRYGFHGLSYAFLMKELARLGGREEAGGRIILAHLGNGASMTAVKEGKSIDTTMSFTPTAGLPMSTRSGDLDPGLVAYLARTEGMSLDQFHEMVNLKSGLLGVSEISSDVRDLLARERHDPRAAEAIALFCYQAKKTVGAFTAALGGLDTLVFSGGIGENAPIVRSRICQGLEFLGIEIESARNDIGASIISKPSSRVRVRVIRTDEEAEIADAVREVLIASTGYAGHESREGPPA